MNQSAAAFDHLCDPYPGDPEVHGPGVVAAQVLDVLRLHLDLGMLQKEAHAGEIRSQRSHAHHGPLLG